MKSWGYGHSRRNGLEQTPGATALRGHDSRASEIVTAAAPEPIGGKAQGEERAWAILLAGGEGKRLRPLTEYVCGDACPKQYAPLLDGRSLLRQTLDRTAMGIPLARTVVIGMQEHARYMDGELTGSAGPRVLLQPADRGTAAAIVLAAHWISWREPGAIIAIFPSDHFVQDEATFVGHVQAVATAVRRHPGRLVMLGAPARDPEPEYGWIEQGTLLDRVGGEPLSLVRGFVEKPSAEWARAAWGRGDLWNTFVLVGEVSRVLDLGWRALPGLSERLDRIGLFTDTRAEPALVARAYAETRGANFSRAILERHLPALAVARLPGSVGWSDWGTPARVIAALRAAHLAPDWLSRLDQQAVTLG
jgi:mannose-1-phosphate guanylyltransferase